MGDPEMHPGMIARNYSSLSALIFLVLEYLWNCHSEYNYIWRARTTPVKWIYLVSRYIGLIGQIVHYTLVHLFLINAPVNHERCRAWFLFLFVLLSVIIGALDAILLLRIYALYTKNVKVHILGLPFTLQFAVASFMMERASHSPFNAQCDKTTSPSEIFLMGVPVVLAHIAFWVTTYAKRNIADGRAVVVQLVVREGDGIVLVLLSIVVCAVAYAVITNSANPFALFVWPAALLSVITCRIILNMNKLNVETPQDQGEFAGSEICLSTIISRV